MVVVAPLRRALRSSEGWEVLLLFLQMVLLLLQLLLLLGQAAVVEQPDGRGGRRRILLSLGGVLSIPPILLDHVSQLDDVLALFVLLARLERVLIFPAERRLTAFTVNVRHCM